jgi:hypothetical protein
MIIAVKIGDRAEDAAGHQRSLFGVVDTDAPGAAHGRLSPPRPDQPGHRHHQPRHRQHPGDSTADHRQPSKDHQQWRDNADDQSNREG